MMVPPRKCHPARYAARATLSALRCPRYAVRATLPALRCPRYAARATLPVLRCPRYAARATLPVLRRHPARSRRVQSPYSAMSPSSYVIRFDLSA